MQINPERVPDVRSELGIFIGDPQFDYRQFLCHIESTIFNVVQSCYPTSWDEDHITFSITDRLSQYKHTEITGLQRPVTIEWDARKLRGPTETAFGDLGILVRFTAWDGQRIEGIGLLEAKKRSRTSSAFEATRKKQLQTIVNSAPRSQLLLYDHGNITEHADNLRFTTFEDQPDSYLAQPSGLPTCHPANAVVLPSHLALALGKYDTSQYKFSIPFSVQLCSRYFRGLDLEFAASVLRRVKGHLSDSGGPRHLLIVSISTGGDADSEPFEELNDELYQPLHHHQ